MKLIKVYSEVLTLGFQIPPEFRCLDGMFWGSKYVQTQGVWKPRVNQQHHLNFKKWISNAAAPKLLPKSRQNHACPPTRMRFFRAVSFYGAMSLQTPIRQATFDLKWCRRHPFFFGVVGVNFSKRRNILSLCTSKSTDSNNMQEHMFV